MKKPNPERNRLLSQIRNDIQFISVTMISNAVVVNARFEEVGDRYLALSEQMVQLGEQSQQEAAQMGQELTRLRDDVDRLGREFERRGQQAILNSRRYDTELREANARARQTGADSSERFHQMAGRMRLLEQRLSIFLGVADRDGAGLRTLCANLDLRLTEVEKRLPPPAA